MRLARRHPQLVKATLALLRSWGCVAFPVKNIATPRTRADGTTVWTRGLLTPGVSDVVACSPSGRFVAVECKVGRDKLRPEQDEFMRRITDLGGVAVVVHDTVDALQRRRGEIARR